MSANNVMLLKIPDMRVSFGSGISPAVAGALVYAIVRPPESGSSTHSEPGRLRFVIILRSNGTVRIFCPFFSPCLLIRCLTTLAG